MAGNSYADETQIARIREEAWSYDELAIRASVDRTTAFRWTQKHLTSMPWATAALLVAQADGYVQLTPEQVTALYAWRARRAIGGTRPRRNMPAWTREDDKPKQEASNHAFD